MSQKTIEGETPLGIAMSILATDLLDESTTDPVTKVGYEDAASTSGSHSYGGDADDVLISTSKSSNLEYQSASGTSTSPKATFNLINSIVGAGMIGIPYALTKSGLVTGILLLIMMGVLTDYSLRLLIHHGILAQKLSYQDLMFHHCGQWGYLVLSFAQAAFPFFGMVSYTIIVGQMYPDALTAIFGNSKMSDRHPVILVATFCLMMPLSMMRDITTLAKWSLLAIVAIVFVGLTLIIESNIVEHPDNRGDMPTIIKPEITQAIGIMAFAYVCHHNVFLVFHSVKDATESKFAKITHAAMAISALLMATVGIAGFIPFGAATDSNVLDNFPEGSKLITACRLLFGMVVMLTYPLECFVVREVIAILARKDAETLTNFQHYGITFVICMIVMSIALATADLGLVLILNGEVNANLLAYLLPGFIGTVASYKRGLEWRNLELLLPFMLFCFGVLVLVVGLAQTFQGDA